MRRKIPLLILALQAAVLAFLLSGILTFRQEEVPLGFKNWTAKNARWDEGWGWSSEEETATEGLITSPELTLPKGTYELTVSYEADSMQSVSLQGRTVSVSQNEKSSTIAFETEQDDEALTIYVNYSGKGGFSIADMAVRTTSALRRRRLVLCILLFVLLDCFGFVWFTGRDPFSLLAVLSIGLLCSLPLLVKGIHGQDLYFHLMRIEALADALAKGVFPLRLSSLYLNGWGYPASIFYGDLLLYAAALLRLAGFSVTNAYKGYILLVNLLGAGVACGSFRTVFREKKTAALSALVWCACSYRFANLYIRAAAGEYTAMVFFPMIAAAFWDLSRRELPDRKHALADVFLFSFGFAGLAVSHVLSVEMAIVASVIASLFMLPRVLRPRSLMILLCGAAGSVLLSLFFVVPFLDSYLHEQVGVLYYGMQDVSAAGIRVPELFSFFGSPFGFENNFPYYRSFSLNPGIVPVAALFAALWLLLSRKGTRMLLALTLLSAVFLWISSDLFPWDMLPGTPLAFMTAIQFPWRWLGFASLLLSLLAGELLTEFGTSFRPAGVLVLTGCVLSVCFFYSADMGYSKVISPYDASEVTLRPNIGAAEYLRYDPDTREGADSEALFSTKAEVTGSDLDWLECVSRDGNTFVLDVMASMDYGGTIDLPVFRYRGMTARDESGTVLPIEDGDNFCVRVAVPAGFDGKITVRFEEPLSWRIASAVSLVSLLGSAVFLFLVRVRRKRKKEA